MGRTFLLAWRYVCFNRLKTGILVACITITLALPAAVHLLVRHYNRELRARARATPLVVGARGNRYDLCLRTLYFKAREPEPLEAGEVDEIIESGLALPIPVYTAYTARKYPVVGTALEYAEFRGLEVRHGTWPLLLGDCVLGSKVAEELGLGVGDHIFSDLESFYDISRRYPLKMHIVGVLAESKTPDDHAVLTDVKTTWVIDGVYHGHMDLRKVDPRAILSRTDGKIVGSAAVFEYNEVTPENMDSFHYHGDPAGFPITAVIVVPKDRKSETIIKGRYEISKTRQLIAPTEVIAELMGIVFQVELFFRANFGIVLLSTVLFLSLVVLLSLRIRRREMETMFKIGCSRMTVFWLQAAELVMILGMSAALSAAVSGCLLLLAPELVSIL